MKIGFTCGAFDLLHAGHIHMLSIAKSHCDHLMVGLHTDPTIDRPEEKNKPIQTVYERYCQLEGLEAVDEIISYDTEADLYDLLATRKIDVRIIGEDWEGKDYTGKEFAGDRYEVIFNSREHSFSSSELRKRIAEHES